MFIALFLVKAGYFGGNLENVFNCKVDYVINQYDYEMFSREYEAEFLNLNKEV